MLALILYQMLGEHVAKEDWMSHVKGTAGIVPERGHESYSEGVAHDLFSSCRMSLVVGELCDGRLTFLAREEWRTLPWKTLPKNDYQRVIDCMTFMPRLVHQWCMVRAISDPDQRHLETLYLVDERSKIHGIFKEWYNSLSTETINLKTTKTTFDAALQYEQSSPPFAESYEFPSLKTANILMLYMGSMIVFNNLLRYAYNAMLGIEASYLAPENPAALRCSNCFYRKQHVHYDDRCTCGWVAAHPHFDISHLPPLTTEHSSETMARQICMSIQYCVKHNLKVMGPYFTLFPLKMAIRYFTANLPETKDELEWCYGVVKMLEQKGFKVQSEDAVYV